MALLASQAQYIKDLLENGVGKVREIDEKFRSSCISLPNKDLSVYNADRREYSAKRMIIPSLLYTEEKYGTTAIQLRLCIGIT